MSIAHALRPRRWSPLPPHHPVSRALMVVVGIIALSTCFGLLHVVDVAVSGALARLQAEPLVAAQPAAQTAKPATGDATAVDATLVEVPPATVDAISL